MGYLIICAIGSNKWQLLGYRQIEVLVTKLFKINMHTSHYTDLLGMILFLIAPVSVLYKFEHTEEWNNSSCKNLLYPLFFMILLAILYAKINLQEITADSRSFHTVLATF